jgi:hypothetical protein
MGSGLLGNGVLFVLQELNTASFFTTDTDRFSSFMSHTRLTMVVLLTMLSATAALAQERIGETTKAVPDTVMQRVTTAFRDGDARRLLSLAADRVEVSLFGTRTFYSRAQAYYVLRNFFDEYPPTNFALVDATGAGKSSFLRGRVDHSRGERPLRTYVRMVRHENGFWQVHEVRIDSGGQ